MQIRSWPLRRLVLAWGLLVAFGLSGLLVVRGVRIAEQLAWRETAEQVGVELSRLALVAERAVQSDPALVAEMVSHAALGDGISLALLRDPAGRVLASTRADDRGQPLASAHPELQALGFGSLGSDAAQVKEDRDGRCLLAARSFAWPAQAGEQRAPARGAVYVVADVGRVIDAHRAAALKDHLVEVLVMLLAWFGLLLAADRWILRPLASLREAAGRLGQGEFQHRAPLGGVQELQALGQAINQMAQDLEHGVLRWVEGEERLRVLTDSAPDAIVTLGVDGLIEHYNAAAERLFGYSASEMRGQTLDRLLPPGTEALHERHVADFAAGEQIGGRRMLAGRLVTGMHRDGRSLHLDVGISSSVMGGHRVFTAVIRDASDRVVAEAALDEYRRQLEDLVRQRTTELVLERDRAQTATRAKSEFLANMSHEIRTPMNAILGLAHLVRRDAPPGQTARVEQMESAAQQLLAMLNDILDFTRIEAGQLSIHEAAADLQLLVDAVCLPLSRQAVSKGLELVQWFDAGLPRRVHVDELRLQQVLKHLVSNAVKFTDRGHVTVRVQRTWAERPANPGHLLRFEVIDTGIGISAEVLERLFQPFEQAEPGQTRRFGGAGMGLVISQRLLRLMGAELEARSVLGEGSTFWFELPCRVDEALPEQTLPRLPEWARRALVADGNPDAGMACCELLRSLGLQAESVASAAEVPARLQTAQDEGRPFDLCLLDAGLGPSGMTALARLAPAVGRWRLPRLVLTTVDSQGHTPAEVQGAGFAVMLCKPLRADRVCEQLLPALGPGREPGRQPAGSAIGAATRFEPELDIEGLDAERGLRILRGNRAAYRGLLERFVAVHQHDAAQLRRLAQAGLGREVHEIAHSLISSAGAVGALQVAAMAAEVPREAVAPEVLAAAAARLAAALEALIARLQALPPPAAVPSSGEGAAADGGPRPASMASAELRQKLRALVAQRDMAAMRFVREQGPALTAVFGPVATPLRVAIDSFDFDTALSLLDGAPDRV